MAKAAAAVFREPAGKVESKARSRFAASLHAYLRVAAATPHIFTCIPSTRLAGDGLFMKTQGGGVSSPAVFKKEGGGRQQSLDCMVEERASGSKAEVQLAWPSSIQTLKATARGFEPLRAEPNGFLVHHLNHSVTLSCCVSVALNILLATFAIVHRLSLIHI